MSYFALTIKRSNYVDGPVLAISLENCYYRSLPEVLMPHKMDLETQRI